MCYILLQGRGVIRYRPFLSVVPYFSENVPLYLINTLFPKNFQNTVPYRRPFSENLIFELFIQIITLFSSFPIVPKKLINKNLRKTTNYLMNK